MPRQKAWTRERQGQAVGLLYAGMAEAIQFARALHILFASMWFGSSMLWMLIVRPVLARHREARHGIVVASPIGPFYGIMALGTVAFGAWAYVATGPSTFADAYGSAGAAVFHLGMTLGILAFLAGFLGHLPISIKLKKAVDGGDMAEAARQEARDARLEKVSFLLVLVTMACMLSFRLFT